MAGGGGNQVIMVDNVNVYGIEESIVASGLSFKSEYDSAEFFLEVESLKVRKEEHPAYKRALKLAKSPAGLGHDCFLKGIIVQMNVTASQVWWLQAERYSHIDIITMQSKMHSLNKMFKTKIANPIPIREAICELFRQIMLEDTDNVELAYNCPMGVCLTARVSTNYMQLKTIYAQRKNHKLPEWQEFCKWIKTLPYAEMITNDNDNN
jgi:hypothetical protein